MFDIFARLGVNRPFRSQDAARAAMGAQVNYDGARWQAVDHNDLGALYWRQIGRGGKLQGPMMCGAGLDSAYERAAMPAPVYG